MQPTNTPAASAPDAKFDILKFILAGMVLAIHSALWPELLYPWLRVAVPLFFMMSSYFLFAKMHGADEARQKLLLRRFVTRNAKLYLCWFVLLLPATLVFRHEAYFAENVWLSLRAILRSVFFGSTFVASWFITATVIGVLLVYFLTRLFKHNAPVFVLVLAAFLIVTVSSSYLSALKDTPIPAFFAALDPFFGEPYCSFPAALFWVFIGKLFAEGKLRLQNPVLLAVGLLVSAALLYAEWRLVFSFSGALNYDSYFALAPTCVLLFAAILKIRPIHWAHGVRFRRASTVIYVLHGTLVRVLDKALEVVLHVSSPLLCFSVTLALCLAVYALIELALERWHGPKLLKLLY